MTRYRALWHSGKHVDCEFMVFVSNPSWTWGSAIKSELLLFAEGDIPLRNPAFWSIANCTMVLNVC